MTGKPQLPTATDMSAGTVERLAAGDMGAAAELYDRYAGNVLSLARRILRNDGDAEEVVQDVFSQAWRTARSFESSRGSVISWLLMMTRTRAIDRLRARESRPDTMAVPYADTLQAPGMNAAEHVLSAEQAARSAAACSARGRAAGVCSLRRPPVASPVAPSPSRSPTNLPEDSPLQRARSTSLAPSNSTRVGESPPRSEVYWSLNDRNHVAIRRQG